MKTVETSWVNCSNSWYNKISLNNVEPLYNALQLAKSAINTVASTADIGSLRISLTFDNIEELNAKRRKLASFCNAIHYEIDQMVDNPFSVSIAELLETAYKLNPSDFKVKTGTTLWWDNITSLKDLMKSTITDVKLKKDFDSKFRYLDKDKPSKDLKEAMKEARFWENEFEKSDQCQKEALALFTPDVRSKWITMSDKEKKKVIKDYVNQISNTLFEKSSTNVKYDADCFGISSGGFLGIDRYISIDPDFIINSTKDFSVDYLIDTLTHETRHQYQDMVRRSPGKYGIPDSLKAEWELPYISDPYFPYYNQEVERDARAFAALSNPVEEEM